MPLRFSSLRRGLLLVAVNHEKGEPHKHSEALGFIYISIFLLNKFRNNHPSLEDCHAVAVGVPLSTSIMRSSLRSISSRRYSRGSRQLARARISFRDNPLNARLRREPGYGSSL